MRPSAPEADATELERRRHGVPQGPYVRRHTERDARGGVPADEVAERDAVTRITSSGQTKRPQRLRVEVVLDPGPDLFSQGPTSRVSSALVGLTAVFGMGTGVTPPLQGPRRRLYQAEREMGKAAPIPAA